MNTAQLWLKRVVLLLVGVVWCGFWGFALSRFLGDAEPMTISAPLTVAPSIVTPPQQIAIPVRDTPFTIRPDGRRDAVLRYSATSNETLFDIAARFDLSYCTLVWSNPPQNLGSKTDLHILPQDGVYYTVAAPMTIGELAMMLGVDPASIIYSPFNHPLLNSTPQTRLQSGQQVVVIGGSLGNCLPWQRPPWLHNNDASTIELLGCDYTNPFRGYPTNAPLNVDYRISRGFTEGHPGIDLVAPEHTPIYAAGDGTIRYAGWHADGYGFVVAVDHGGSHTVYGHLSGITVSCGQPVQARQLIGTMGSTGNSNAVHLHFEVRDGGFNPISPRKTLDLGF